MVSLDKMRASNAKIATSLPSNLVAVFAGATSGIGETAVRQFAKHTVKPKIFILGRGQASGDRIAAELQNLNPGGQYTFLSCDLSLIRNVDAVCEQIKKTETSINLLFITIGTLVSGKETSEGLYYPMAVTYFARVRLMQNLLPLIRTASSLRRVVNVFAGTKEGKINLDDLQSRKTLLFFRPHLASLLTLSLISLSKEAPEVGFVHNFPGAVKSSLGNDLSGTGMKLLLALYRAVEPFVTMPLEEAGERQVFFGTSERFRGYGEGSDGVPTEKGVDLGRGVDGHVKSGVYSVNSNGESAPKDVEVLLTKMRDDGVIEKIWAYTNNELARITA